MPGGDIGGDQTGGSGSSAQIIVAPVLTLSNSAGGIQVLCPAGVPNADSVTLERIAGGVTTTLSTAATFPYTDSAYTGDLNGVVYAAWGVNSFGAGPIGSVGINYIQTGVPPMCTVMVELPYSDGTEVGTIEIPGLPLDFNGTFVANHPKPVTANASTGLITFSPIPQGIAFLLTVVACGIIRRAYTAPYTPGFQITM